MVKGRRRVEPDQIGIIAGWYLTARGCRLLERGEGWLRAVCPGCGEGDYKIDLRSGRAGCTNVGCEVPRNETWIGVVAHFEGFDRRDDREEIRRIGFGILHEHEERLRRKAAKTRRAEAEQRRQAEETREIEREAERRAEAEERQRRTARTEEEQRLLDRHRAKQEHLRRREEAEEAEKARREEEDRREERHLNAEARAVAAAAPILVAEMVMAVLIGVVALVTVYYCAGWLQAWDVLGPALLPWRFPAGLLVGLSLGTWTALSLSRGRRQRHAIDSDEYLGVYRSHEHEEGRLIFVDTKADLREISREPLRRYAPSVDRAVRAVERALATVAEVLGTGERPWLGIIVWFLLAGLVAWLVLAYLSASSVVAAAAATAVFYVRVIVRWMGR